MARKSQAKLEDVNLKLDKFGELDIPKDHSTTPKKAKDKMESQNDQAANEVANSKSSDIYIQPNIPDFNNTGTEDNPENIFVKKDENGQLKGSNYKNYSENIEKNKKEASKNPEDIDIKKLQGEDTQQTEQDNEKLSTYEKSKAKESNYGTYVNVRELEGDVSKTNFSAPQTDRYVDIYNGEGKKLGVRPLSENNQLGTRIIKDFYIAIARLVEGAAIKGINLNIVRGYQSFEEQLEIRRKYAPENRKSDNEWLKNANPNAGFKNENGDNIKVQKPGYGYHILGNTFDINTSDKRAYKWLVENAHNFGFYRTISSEIWHWEYKPWLYRLGGKQNPGDPQLISGYPTNYIGGWANELWQTLYKKVSNKEDPKGAKFVPKKHDSWLGYETNVKTELIDNSIPTYLLDDEDITTGSTFVDVVEETEAPKTKEDIDRSEKLSKYLTLQEVIVSSTAERKGIDNRPDKDAHYKNLKLLAKEIYDPIYSHLRNQYNLSITVSSGYRSEALNNEIGGSSTSQHTTGEAIDIVCSNPNKNYIIYQYIKNNLNYDQLIWEAGDGKNPEWVHVSFTSTNNRKERLAYRPNAKDKYISADNYLA